MRKENDPKDQMIDVEPHLLAVLESLNQISAAIHCSSQGEQGDVSAVLRLIVESTVRLVPGAAAVIYTYDPGTHEFDVHSRFSNGEWATLSFGDHPRPGGIGQRAVEQRRRVLTYEESDLAIHPAFSQAGARTAACFPLLVADEVVGVLYVHIPEERKFTPVELMVLEILVNQAAMALYQSRQLTSVQRDLARKEEELKHLRRTGLLISSRLRLEETLESILQMALEITNARYGIFRLLDKTGQNLITRAIAGDAFVQPQVENLPIDSNSVMSFVARTRQPVLIADLMAEPWSTIYYPLDKELQMRSELAVPLISTGGRLEGVLNLESPRVGAFTEQDSHLLQTFATQAVIAIQEVRLLDALQEVAELLLSQSSQQVLTRLTELACDLLNAATGAIWLVEDDWLVLQASNGNYQHEQRLPLYGSLAGEVIRNGVAIVTDDVRTDSRFNRPDLARAQEWTRALVVPLLAVESGVTPGATSSTPLGAFSVYSSTTGSERFAETEWDKKMLACLAYYAVLAIQNTKRQDALRAAQEQRAVAETFAVVGDIAANLLHHLNNKVGTIPVRIQGIQDKCRATLVSDHYLATNLSEIERSANEAMQAMRENLSHLRPLNLGEVQVAACVSAAVESINLPKSITIRIQNLNALPPVIANQRTLTLVFHNLLDNAAEAMHGEGAITIRGALRGEWVEISVSDSGPGIPPELHDRIFELNYSNRGAVKNHKLGFGLWWVKTLMARLGGSVSVESDGSHGTAFRLRLPLAGRLSP